MIRFYTVMFWAALAVTCGPETTAFLLPMWLCLCRAIELQHVKTP